MPTFRPPLSYTSRIDVHPSPSEQSYVHLTFVATFEQDEDTSGTWEIWTDLPSLDASGSAPSGAGSWRSIPFQPIDIGKALVNGRETKDHASSSSHLKLSATPLPEPLQENVTRLSLSTSVLANAGQTFAYTYRRILPSGEIHWLGGEGSNGVISVVEGSMHGRRIGDASWQGEPPDDETVTFSGIAIELVDVNGKQEAKIHHVPADHAVSSDLMILSGTIPLSSTPFYRLAHTAAARATYLNTPQAIHIPSPSSKLSLAAGQMLPTVAGMDSLKYFDNDGKMATVVGRALAAAKKDVWFERCAVTSESRDVEDVVVLYHSGKGKSSLVVYAPNSLVEREITVTLPTEKKPLAVIAGDHGIYLPESTDSPAINLSLPVGTVAQTLLVHEFTNISPDPSKAVYVVAPTASNVESIHAQSVTSAVATAEPTTEAVSQGEDNVDLIEESSAANSEEIAKNDELESNEGSWLFALGQFFVGIWNWICGAFGTSKETAVDQDAAGRDNIDEDEESEEEVMTPPNESTPLLGDTALSRAASSTTFQQTPPITPDSKLSSASIAKAKVKAGSSVPSSIGQAATQFTFEHRPPFTFFLPTVDGLAFSTKSRDSWQVQDGSKESLDGGLVRLEITGNDDCRIVKVELV